MKNNYVKSLLILFAIGTNANNVSAQGPYGSLYTGYAFKAGTQNLPGIYNSNVPGGNNIRNYEQINTSFGAGVNVGAAIGYMFNPFIGAELGLSYLKGDRTGAMHNDNNGSTEYIVSANIFRINPSIVIASGFDNFNPYAKFGLVVGIGSIMTETNDINNGNIENIQFKSNGGSALGFSSAVGALFSLNEKISIFGELNLINMSYAPEQGIIIKDTYNGRDRLPDMTTREKEVIFVDSYSYDPNNQPSSGLPNVALKQKMPFGSFGINIGLRLHF